MERFESLYRSSRDDVYAYVSTLLRDPAAAEDITALAFERAYRRRRSSIGAAAKSGRGCSVSLGTPRWMSFAGGPGHRAA